MALPLTCLQFFKHNNILLCKKINIHQNTKHFQLKCLKRPSSVNYQPTSWSQDFYKSLKNDHMDKKNKDDNANASLRKMVEEEVRMSIIKSESESALKLLEFIDDIERLGVGYCFEKEISEALNRIVGNNNLGKEESLHATSLTFRLLRKHGYHVSQDMFICFKDDAGGFKNSLKEDVNGMLSLYEASYLAFEGETLLEEAKSFTISHLKNINLQSVNHAIEMPLHYRMLRLEARWYIDAYSKKEDANHSLLQFAILDFNMVQSIFQDDLLETSRWWEYTRLASNLSFIRDRLMECYFWTVGIVFEPQYSHCRKELTKVTSLITTIDDVYDVYGTLDELHLFTDAVKSWDVRVTNSLPDDMKLCFLVLHNTVNEMAYDNLKLQGINTISILQKIRRYHQISGDLTAATVRHRIHLFLISHAADPNRGQIYVKDSWWKQSGTKINIPQNLKNISKTRGGQFPALS